jgi:hypothetical protein
MCSLYDARGSVGRFCFLICSFVLLGVIPAFAADARYAAIKKLARNEFQNDCNEFNVETEPGGSKMKEGDRLRFNLAMSVVKLESAIKKAGYDLSGFNEAIKTFENKSLEKGRIITESARREDYELIRYPYAALNQEAERQRRAKPKLAKFHVEGGCGAGEVPVFFDRSPNLHSAKLIRAGFLVLCALDIKNGTDPHKRSLTDCNWEPIAFKKANSLSGRYVIWSYWADGSCSASTQDIGYFDTRKVAPDQLRYPLEKTDRTCRQ